MRGYFYLSLIIAVCSLGVTSAYAQTPSLSSQINAVAQAQHRLEAKRAEERADAERRYRAEQARIAEQERVREAKAEARERAREAKIEAREKAQEAARAKIAAQNRQFVLEQRKLQLESEQLDLQAKKTLVDRENDAINSALARQKAKTDLIQSQADSNRDLASGTKTLLQDAGTADINRSLAHESKTNVRTNGNTQNN